MREVTDRLQQLADAKPTKRLEARLLCDPELTVDQWGRVALAIGEYVEEIRIGPLSPALPSLFAM